MEEYGPETYGERIADVYDQWYPDAPPAMIDRLAEMAGEGRALELAIGTGRVALPLASKGVDIHGVDVSEDMVARLRTKQGGDRIPVTMGDFAEVPVEGKFGLIFIVFNTLFALLTQQDQVRCFRNVASRLEPGGAFVLEAFVPDLTRFDRGQRVAVAETEATQVRLEASIIDTGGTDRHGPAHRSRRGWCEVETRGDPLRLAGRAGPDGTARRYGVGCPMGRLGRLSLHRRLHRACLRIPPHREVGRPVV